MNDIDPIIQNSLFCGL